MPDPAIYLGAILLVFFLRLAGVAVGTVRILLTNRGNELWSGVLGFFEVLVYVLGIGVVVQDLTDIAMLMSYCLGFSFGTILGIRIEQRMAMGYVNLRTISRYMAPSIAAALREAGFGATLSHGEGRDGTVGIITATVPRKQANRAMKLVHCLDPDAFMVADEARAVTRGWLPGAASIFPLAPGAARGATPPPPATEPAVEFFEEDESAEPAAETAQPAPGPGAA